MLIRQFGPNISLLHVWGNTSSAWARLTRTNLCLRQFSSFERSCKFSSRKRIYNPVLLQYNQPLRCMSVQQQRWKKRGAVMLSWKSLLMAGTTIALMYAFQYWAEGKHLKTWEESTSSGKMMIGGDWALTDMNDKPISSEDFKGQWYFLYFGFCNCPDICPDELEKVSAVMDELGQVKNLQKMKTVFITVDPWRDSSSVLKTYCEEFHGDLIGVSGAVEDVKEAARKFRIYVSKGPIDSDGDYIVDHSIITYLVDPTGEVQHYYNNTKDKDHMVQDIQDRMTKYNKEHRKKIFGWF